jgi:hypothetical protein
MVMPSAAMGAWTQKVQAGFLPEFGAQIPIPPPHLNLGPKDSKAGTLYTRLFLDPNPGNAAPPPSVGVIDIHAPEELTFKTQGLPQCNPDTIRGRTDADARSLCEDALLGSGNAEAYLAPGVTLKGKTALFNGTPQNGFPTVLFHSTAGTPITLVAEVQDSPLEGYGTMFHTRVAVSAGGGVPDGTPIVDTDFTLSKQYTDEKLAKKAKKLKKKAKDASGSKARKLKSKARKLKKKSKVSWVVARCGDGVGTTRVDTTYVFGSGPQTATTEQPCS